MVIVDDDLAFANALVSMLERDERVEVVGTAANGREALDAVARLRPDAVTMDLDMPVLDGIGATRAIAQSHPSVAVIVVSASESGDGVRRALEVGAVTQIAKSDAWDLLVPALLAVRTTQLSATERP